MEVDRAGIPKYAWTKSARNHKQLKDHYENYLRPNLTTE
jgi:hypothetical protein